MGDCDKNLEKYKILYTAYADEIRNLWQRSIFLGAFMVLVWSGYGALQLKFITRKCSEFDMATYFIASLGLCAMIIALSLLWIAMAKGSKFVQEAHEKQIENFIEENKDLKILYCNLKDYEYLSKSEKLFSFGVLTPFRYSPSKINIALGWVSFVVAIILLVIHICVWCCF